ncbi:MAG: radical SAM protein [Proteobacteria bacterium]|nr:radical SAM protein [Pseudomonadota bacterium]
MRGLASREVGALKKDWGGKASIALVFPNTYRVGMGNLAVHSIYSILNARSAVVCERAFMPHPSELREHILSRTPVLSVESQRPLAEFDVVALSLSFENDYLNLPEIFGLSKIPLRAADRRPDQPLVIAGGAAPTLNPLPLALVADAILPGEFEAFADRVAPILEEGLPGREALVELGKVPGVIVGAPGAPAERMRAGDLDSFKTQTAIYSREAEFGDMHLIEVERGCRHRCRFCATPAIYGEPRRRSASAVLRMVDEGLAHRRKFGLIGADILSHPDFEEIAEGILDRGGSFSPSSVRVDAMDARKAELLRRAGHRSLALGIEAGSEALRRTLGKGLSDRRILESVEALAVCGITRLRLYFMTGLPGETDADVAAIASIALRIRDLMRAAAPRSSRATAVDLTVTPFVPKPDTPFAGRPFAGEAEIKRRFRALKATLSREPGVAMRTDSALQAAIEHRLANSGPEAVRFLEESRERSARAAMRG